MVHGLGVNIYWLVVDLPLWKMMEFVSWDDYSIPNSLWKVKSNSMVPVTTSQPLHLNPHVGYGVCGAPKYGEIYPQKVIKSSLEVHFQVDPHEIPFNILNPKSYYDLCWNPDPIPANPKSQFFVGKIPIWWPQRSGSTFPGPWSRRFRRIPAVGHHRFRKNWFFDKAEM